MGLDDFTVPLRVEFQCEKKICAIEPNIGRTADYVGEETFGPKIRLRLLLLRQFS
jgi:hypothetical protein